MVSLVLFRRGDVTFDPAGEGVRPVNDTGQEFAVAACPHNSERMPVETANRLVV